MRKPTMIAITISLLALAASHPSPQATNAAAERLFVTTLNAVFRVASSELLPGPPIRPRPRCELTRHAPAVRIATEKRTEVCAKTLKAADDPIVLRARKRTRVVAF